MAWKTILSVVDRRLIENIIFHQQEDARVYLNSEIEQIQSKFGTVIFTQIRSSIRERFYYKYIKIDKKDQNMKQSWAKQPKCVYTRKLQSIYIATSKAGSITDLQIMRLP